MKLCIRPPQENEWPICRMLLPETFSNVSSRTYLLAVRDEAPRVVAAASFREGPEAVTHLRLHVVRFVSPAWCRVATDRFYRPQRRAFRRRYC